MSEALLRIEHKLDMILEALKDKGIMITDLPQMDEDDLCPVCDQEVKYDLDLQGERVSRSCGCKPPVRVVPGISNLMKPPEKTNGRYSRTEADDVRPEPEDSSGPGSGSGRNVSGHPSRQE